MICGECNAKRFSDVIRENDRHFEHIAILRAADAQISAANSLKDVAIALKHIVAANDKKELEKAVNGIVASLPEKATTASTVSAASSIPPLKVPGLPPVPGIL